MALINACERACSVVSGTFSLLYMFKKADFDKIMNYNPEIANHIRHTSKMRTASINIMTEDEGEVMSSQVQQEIYNELAMGSNPNIFQKSIFRQSGRRTLSSKISADEDVEI
jgi:signal-transduction protein with cAMP-binding, CBS, and nucleotidyltransferase domain